MPTPTELFKNKLDFLDEAETGLTKTVSLAERWLFRRIVNEIVPDLKRENGTITNDVGNITLFTNRLNSLFKRFGREQNSNIVKQIVGDFQNISTLNSGYFLEVSGKTAKEFGTVSKRVELLMRRSLGLNANGTIKANSFLDTIGSNAEINKRIREMAVRQIQGGAKVSDFTAELGNLIKSDEEGLGVLNRYYNQTVNDRYSQYERAESKTYADSLGFQAFIYSGGKVNDTRRFCCQRNGLIFTRAEAQQWSKLKFQGKNKGYVPLVDLGGYNCRHSTQWISDRVALRRRPDLKLSETGKLIQDKDKPKQKLNRPCSK